MDPNPTVRRVTVRPQTRQEPDGTWTAWYPEYGFEVTAPTAQEAIHRLREENARRKEHDPEYRARLEELFRDPPASWEVVEIPREEYERRLREAGQAPPWGDERGPLEMLREQSPEP